MAMVGSIQTKAPGLLTTPAPASPAPQLVQPQPEKTSSQRAFQASSDPSSKKPGSIDGPPATGRISPPSKTQGLATKAGEDSKANQPALVHQDTDHPPANGGPLPTSTTEGVGPQQGSDSNSNAAELARQGTGNSPAASPGIGNPSLVGPHAPDPPANPAPTSLFTNSYDPLLSIKAVENGPAASFEAGSFSVAGPQPFSSPASSPPANSPTNRQRPSGVRGDALLAQSTLSQDSLAANALAAHVFTHAASRSTVIAADLSEMPDILHTSVASFVGTFKLTDVGSMPLSETDHMDGLVSNGLDRSEAFNLGHLAGVTAQAAAEPLSSNSGIVAPVQPDAQAHVPPIIVGTVMYSPVLPATRVPGSPEAGTSSNVPSDGTIPAPGEPNAIPGTIGSKGNPTDSTARPNMPPDLVNAVAEQPGLTSLMLTKQPIVTGLKSAIPGQSSHASGVEGPAQSQGDSPAVQTKYAPAQANSASIVVGGTTYTPVPASSTSQAAYSSPGDTSPQHPLSSNPSDRRAASETGSYGIDTSGNPSSESASSIESGSVIPRSTTTNGTQASSSGANTATASASAQAYVGGVARVAVGISGSICSAMMILGWMALTF